MKVRSLRTRFLFSSCLLLAATIACGAWSVYTFRWLGAAVNNTLGQNQATIDLAVELISALEREDAALLLSLNGDTTHAADALRTERARFESAFQRMQPHLDTASEQAALAGLRADADAYREVGNALLAIAGKPSAQEAYYKQVNPALRKAVTDARQIRALKVEAIRATGHAAREEARRSSIIVTAIALTAFLLSVGVVLFLTRSVLRPIDELDQAVEALRCEELECQVPVRSADELGRLAAGFNRMAATLAAYRRETEERFRQMAENIHEIFWMTDTRRERVIYVSPGYEDIWGRTCESLYEDPTSWIESIHPDDREMVVKNHEQRSRGVFADLEFRVVHPDQTLRWVRSRAFPIHDQHGNVKRIAGLVEDITNRKQTEEALRQANARLDLAVRGSNVGIWEIDMPDGNYENGLVHCLNVWEQLGYEARDTPSDLATWKALWHPLDRERVERAAQAYLDGETREFQAEYRINHRDGSHRWVLSRGIAVRDLSGRPIRFVGSRFDITERKRIEEALRESEERFRGTFENAAVGMAHVDVNGRYLRVNQKLCAIVGYTCQELLARSFQEITYPEDLEVDLEQFRLLKNGDIASFSREKRYIRKNGSLVWVAVSVSLQRDLPGQPTNTISIVQDITEHRRLEKELRQAKETAEAANRAKDEFLANVSHEIRTPMNAILGMTELVLDTALMDDQRQCLQTVKSAADNLLVVINDLLDFSRIAAGKLELDPAPFSLQAVLGDTLRALAVRAHRKGLELVCQVQPDVPDALIGDAGRLRQVLLNLVGNAIKFTDQGEVVVQVEATATRTSEDDINLRFTVRDTGIGIHPDRQDKIFHAFEQEDSSTTRRYGGTGLGLTIAARLVALMSGEISVRSQPGQGSTFTFTAPFRRQAESAVPTVSLPSVDDRSLELSHLREHRTPARLLKPVQPGDLRATIHDVMSQPNGTTAQPLRFAPLHLPAPVTLNILVAEDNEFNSQLLEQLLTRRGHRVRVATTGREALDLAIGGGFDALLLDIHMPELDGFQVVQAVRAHEQSTGGHLPIIASTARARLEDRQRCLAAGMDDFLTKPIQTAALEKALGRVRARDADDVSQEPPLLDPVVLLAACGEDDAILESICRMLQARLPDHLQLVRESFGKQDAIQLREAAHKLCGMVAAFSTVARTVASDLEDRAAEEQLDAARPLVEQLEGLCQRLVQTVSNLSLERLRQLAGMSAATGRPSE